METKTDTYDMAVIARIKELELEYNGKQRKQIDSNCKDNLQRLAKARAHMLKPLAKAFANKIKNEKKLSELTTKPHESSMIENFELVRDVYAIDSLERKINKIDQTILVLKKDLAENQMETIAYQTVALDDIID